MLQDSYHTMGLVHEALNSPRKALDFYMIAAHLSPKDSGLWRRLSMLSTELGFLRYGKLGFLRHGSTAVRQQRG